MEANTKEIVEQVENGENSEAYNTIMGKLDELEIVTDKLVKTSRLRGIIEGSLVTGGLALGTLLAATVLKRT